MSLPPRSTLFPYTTLFRSLEQIGVGLAKGLTVEEFEDAQKIAADGNRTRERTAQALGGSGFEAGKSRIVRNVAEPGRRRSEEHTSELQSLRHLVCRLLLEK